MQEMHLLDTVDETLRYVCPSWGSDDEVDDSWEKALPFRTRPDQVRWNGLEGNQEKIQGFKTGLRADHAIAAFWKRIRDYCGIFIETGFYKDCKA